MQITILDNFFLIYHLFFILFVKRKFIQQLNLKILNTFIDLPSGYDYNPPKGYSADSNPTFPNHVKVICRRNG